MTRRYPAVGGTPTGSKFLRDDQTWATPTGEAFPVGAVFISVVSTNPATLLGYGTWSAFGAGRVLVGLDSGDANFDVVEETGGAKTVAAAGTISAPTLSGSTAAESSHTHSVTSNVAVADHSSHTHSTTLSGNTGSTAVTASGSPAPQEIDPGTGGIFATISTHTHPSHTHTMNTGPFTSGGPSATLTHSVTNNAVTSGAGSSHSHGVGTLAASAPTFTGSATSVVQPYIVAYFWKRTA